jgi:hypothetical protein
MIFGVCDVHVMRVIPVVFMVSCVSMGLGCLWLLLRCDALRHFNGLIADIRVLRGLQGKFKCWRDTDGPFDPSPLVCDEDRRGFLGETILKDLIGLTLSRQIVDPLQCLISGNYPA